jgi:hypothetical protein
MVWEKRDQIPEGDPFIVETGCGLAELTPGKGLGRFYDR